MLMPNKVVHNPSFADFESPRFGLVFVTQWTDLTAASVLFFLHYLSICQDNFPLVLEPKKKNKLIFTVNLNLYSSINQSVECPMQRLHHTVTHLFGGLRWLSRLFGGLRWLSCLNDGRPPRMSRFRALYRTSDGTWEEFVNTLPKVVVFCGFSSFIPQETFTGWVRNNS